MLTDGRTDERTDGQTDERKETCTSKSPMLKQVRQKRKEKIQNTVICQKVFFYGIKLLHANVQCVYNVYAKYQTVSVKAVVVVDFLTHALSSTIQNYKGR